MDHRECLGVAENWFGDVVRRIFHMCGGAGSNIILLTHTTSHMNSTTQKTPFAQLMAFISLRAFSGVDAAVSCEVCESGAISLPNYLIGKFPGST